MRELFKNKYRSDSSRAAWWDYGENAIYFVTICTSNHQEYFGEIIDGKMILSEIGTQATQCWVSIPEHFPFIKLDEFTIMPNHLHGILIINKSVLINKSPSKVGTNSPIKMQYFASLQNKNHRQQKNSQHIKSKNKFGPQSNNLASIIRGFKIGVTIYCKQKKYLFGWQPRYHDHIIRDNDELKRIRFYIINNPKNWSGDEHFLQ